MRDLIALVTRAAPGRIDVAYAVKANPRPELLAALVGTGCHFDVASAGELARVLAQGVPGERIVFSGPGKAREELEEGLARGARINCEGPRDLALVARWAAGARRPVEVNLRINPAAAGRGAGAIIGGAGPSRFGVDEALVADVIARSAAGSRLAIAGVQVFTASNVLDAGELAGHHRRAFALARRVQEATGRPLDTIDLGGGLGIPYADAESELDVASVAAALADLIARSRWFPGRVLLEPGRWIAGPAGAYVCAIREVKWSQGVRFAVMDGGIHHLLRPALLARDQPCLVLPRAGGRSPAGPVVPTTFGGPLCTGLDVLAHDVPCGDVDEGDLVAFLQAGAYGETEAMPEFLLHPRARIALVGPGPAGAVTRRGRRYCTESSGR
jgi:diaminopimelate decarboxylase